MQTSRVVREKMKICSKFTGEHPCSSVIKTKLLSDFIEIALWHGFSTENLLRIFRKFFPKDTSSRWQLLPIRIIWIDRILLLYNVFIVLFNKNVCNILNGTMPCETKQRFNKNENGFVVNSLLVFSSSSVIITKTTDITLTFSYKIKVNLSVLCGKYKSLDYMWCFARLGTICTTSKREKTSLKHSSMGVSHVSEIVQMVPDCAKRLIWS